MSTQLTDLVLQASTTAATGLALLMARDALLGAKSARTELKAFTIRCTVGVVRLLRLTDKTRLAAVQIGVILYQVERLLLFHGLNGYVLLRVLSDLFRAVYEGLSKWVHRAK